MKPEDIKAFFKNMGLPVPVLELEFHPTRKWAFDLAWPEYKIAMEVEGGIHSGGRHVAPKGFLGDMKKYNTAAVMGWRVLRVSPKTVISLISSKLLRDAIAGRET